MPHSTRSSDVSAPCRLEWRPSRWVVAALFALAALASLSLIASDLPRMAAWPLAAVACATGVWRARREWRRPACAIVIAADGRASVDAGIVEDLHIVWRGTLAFVCWRDAAGRTRRCSFWPDTLSVGQRRELRLAVMRLSGAPGVSAMAH